MLRTLGRSPQKLDSPATSPATSPLRWLGPPPPTRPADKGVQLAPGVWVVRHRRWLDPGELDTAADIIDHPDAEPRRVVRSGYSPPAWHRQAVCARLPISLSNPLFFGTDSLADPEDLIVAVDAARHVCASCPVRRECLTDALTNDMRFGVWAGTSGRERKKMRAQIAAGQATVEELVDRWLR